MFDRLITKSLSPGLHKFWLTFLLLVTGTSGASAAQVDLFPSGPFNNVLDLPVSTDMFWAEEVLKCFDVEACVHVWSMVWFILIPAIARAQIQESSWAQLCWACCEAWYTMLRISSLTVWSMEADALTLESFSKAVPLPSSGFNGWGIQMSRKKWLGLEEEGAWSAWQPWEALAMTKSMVKLKPHMKSRECFYVAPWECNHANTASSHFRIENLDICSKQGSVSSWCTNRPFDAWHLDQSPAVKQPIATDLRYGMGHGKMSRSRPFVTKRYRNLNRNHKWITSAL